VIQASARLLSYLAQTATAKSASVASEVDVSIDLTPTLPTARPRNY
jgi:hypothetical protein